MRRLGTLLRHVLTRLVRWYWTLRFSFASPEALARSLPVERKAAELELVPRRCGLCKHFSREGFEQQLKTEPAFAEVTRRLKPYQLGSKTREERDAPPPPPGSERARELRPALTEDWTDYGQCTKHGPVIWGFAEQPAMPNPDSPKCGAWK